MSEELPPASPDPDRPGPDPLPGGAGLPPVVWCGASHPDAAQPVLPSCLPRLDTTAELARALCLSSSRLRLLEAHEPGQSSRTYQRVRPHRQDRKSRILAVACAPLALVQQWIRTVILDPIPVDAAAHAYLHGRSAATSAAMHKGKAVVVAVDLRSFFHSIRLTQVQRVFLGIGYPPEVALSLALLCTYQPFPPDDTDGLPRSVPARGRCLPQGACTSPALSNLVCRRMDALLTEEAGASGFIYSRYADDLAFSGGEAAAARVGELLRRVESAVAAFGFVLNAGKTRVMRQGRRQQVVGLVVNETVGPIRYEVRRLRAILNCCTRRGFVAANREGRADFLGWLRGKIAWLAQTRPKAAEWMTAELEWATMLHLGGFKDD